MTTPSDIIKDPYVFEFLGISKAKPAMENEPGGLSNNIFASRYTYVIPKKEELIAQVEAVLREWHSRIKRIEVTV